MHRSRWSLTVENLIKRMSRILKFWQVFSIGLFVTSFPHQCIGFDRGCFQGALNSNFISIFLFLTLLFYLSFEGRISLSRLRSGLIATNFFDAHMLASEKGCCIIFPFPCKSENVSANVLPIYIRISEISEVMTVVCFYAPMIVWRTMTCGIEFVE